jgi:signal transduction histidine kinase
MNNLIDDLLDLAKLENNAFQLNIDEFNLIELIQDAFSIVMFQAENKNIRLYLRMDINRAQNFK